MPITLKTAIGAMCNAPIVAKTVVQASLRKITKTRASFPNDEAAIKLLYLGLRNLSQRWTMPIQNWKQAMSQLMIRFEAQFNNA